MARFEESRRSALATAVSVQIEGIPLDQSEEMRIGKKGWFPIGGCICVTEPCPCDGPIVWLPEDGVVVRESTGRKTEGGDEVMRFLLEKNAKVILEAFLPVKAQGISSLAKLKQGGLTLAGVRAGSRTGASGNGHVTTMSAPAPGGPTGAVAGAFWAGYEFGEWLDEEFGLSDAISDWMVDVFD